MLARLGQEVIDRHLTYELTVRKADVQMCDITQNPLIGTGNDSAFPLRVFLLREQAVLDIFFCKYDGVVFVKRSGRVTGVDPPERNTRRSGYRFPVSSPAIANTPKNECSDGTLAASSCQSSRRGHAGFASCALVVRARCLEMFCRCQTPAPLA